MEGNWGSWDEKQQSPVILSPSIEKHIENRSQCKYQYVNNRFTWEDRNAPHLEDV